MDHHGLSSWLAEIWMIFPRTAEFCNRFGAGLFSRSLEACDRLDWRIGLRERRESCPALLRRLGLCIRGRLQTG